MKGYYRIRLDTFESTLFDPLIKATNGRIKKAAKFLVKEIQADLRAFRYPPASTDPSRPPYMRTGTAAKSVIATQAKTWGGNKNANEFRVVIRPAGWYLYNYEFGGHAHVRGRFRKWFTFTYNRVSAQAFSIMKGDK